MAKIVLVVICGVLVFVLVSRFAPHFLETLTPANPEATAAAAAEEEAKSKTKAKSKSATSRSRANAARTTSKADTASATSVAELPAAIPAGTTLDTPAPATDSRPVVKVADDATLYRTNTAGGPVVAWLPKGAVVEPVFVVSTAGQNWTFVSADDDEVSGFIRTETLSRSQSTETGRQ